MPLPSNDPGSDLDPYHRRLEGLVAARTLELTAVNSSLEDTARLNRTITDAMPGHVAYWDASGLCRFANPGYAQWFGLTPALILGRNGPEVFGARYQGEVKPRLDAAMRGERQHFQQETDLPDGRHFVHQVHLVPETDAAGLVRGVLVMAFDITELKSTEHALKLSNEALAISRDRAETANRAKSSFLTNMSHEIRTPMNAVIGLTHLLARDAKDAKQRDRLGKISDAAQHLLQIVNNMLDLSNIEAGKPARDTNAEADTAQPAPPDRKRLSLNESLELLRARQAGRRVLLAEDNPVNQEVAEDLLRLAQLVVETAPDGARAIEMAVTRPYDLVLMDVQMPDLDGLSATRSIRRHGQRMPVIAMTANAFLEDREACLAAGMNDHLSKPVDPGALYEMLLRWLPPREQAATAPAAGMAPTAAMAPGPLRPQPARPQGPGLLQRLAAVDGLDARTALQNVGGREAMLQRVLERFVATYRPGEPALLAHGGDLAAGLRRACHSLEGAFAAIAATALYSEVLVLKDWLDAPDLEAAQQHASVVHAQLLRFTESLAAALTG